MKYFILTALIIVFVEPFSVIADTKPEDEFKAAYIYHFTKYIQWQDVESSETFVIAVIGDSEIITPLREIEKKRMVNSKKIKIVHFQDITDITDCHILFISSLDMEQLSEILEKVKGKNILTISDSTGFASKGVAINFVIIDNKVKFEINSSAYKQAGLKMSSQLLKLAILIEGTKSDD
jgi:hypothetical protein